MTLRQTSFAGHVCLFAGPGISRRTVRQIRGYDVEVVPYRRSFPFVADPHPKSPKSLPTPIYVFNYRHFLYDDYLLKHDRRFRNVLLTDIKDVVFQRNPFEFETSDRLYVAMENTSIPIGNCSCTSKWIHAGYGPEVLQGLKDKEVSCAGTVLGSELGVRHYLRSMLEQIQRMRDAFHCADQAAHNLMLHEGRLDPVTRLYNFNGPIATIGTETNVARNDRGELINEDGSVIAVIHQYDRHPDLTDLFERKAYPSQWRRYAAKLRWAGVRQAREAKSATRRRFGVFFSKLVLRGDRTAVASRR